MKCVKRLLAVFIMAAVAATFIPLMDGEVYAAAKKSKKPAAPKITYAKEITDQYDEFKFVRVKWNKVKGAKRYEVGVRSSQKKWVKVKTVKKSAKNKKKYTKKGKYKVVAKGKKYVVYKYTYKFIRLDATKSCSYLFETGDDWSDLRGNTTYIFAVRTLKGGKYSKWSTVAVKTGTPQFEGKELTSPGQSVTTNIDGKSVTLTVGKQCTVPITKPKKGTLAAKPFAIIPSKVEYSLFRFKDGNEEHIKVEGKTPDGYDVSWDTSIYGGVSDHTYFNLYYPNFSNSDYSKYKTESLGYGPGYIGTKYTVKNPKITVVWTTDGTEPIYGQADKSIKGNEYPFGQVMSGNTPVDGSVQVRGSANYSDGYTSIWRELSSYGYFNHCDWIRIYEGNTLVEERFQYAGYYK